LVDAGLLKKPRWDSHAHSVSDDIWEAFCTTYKIHWCEPKVLNFSNIKSWGIGKKLSAFLRLGGLSPLIQRNRDKRWDGRLDEGTEASVTKDFWMQGWTEAQN
jgi:hypothetical protein